MRVLSIIAAALIGLIIGSALMLSFWVYRTVHIPHRHSKANDFVKIEKGSTPKQIIAKLAEEGIVPNYAATYLYVRLFGDVTKLQAGEYQFDSPITPLQVLNELETGQERTVKLTIPEGFTRFDIAKRIVEKFPQDPPVNETDILQLMDDTSLITDIAPD